MGLEVTVGQEVTVLTLSGPVKRIVVGINGSVLAVCRSETIHKANNERKLPVFLGISINDVIESGRQIFVDLPNVLKHNVQYEPPARRQARANRLGPRRGQQPAGDLSHGGRVNQHGDEAAGGLGDGVLGLSGQGAEESEV